jgi:hypothetical protein
MRQLFARAVFGLVLLALAACGGGGGGGSGGGGGGGGGGSGNQSPTADAGPAQIGDVGQLITFDGSRSTDPETTVSLYEWTVTSRPAGSTAALTNPNTALPTFRPDVAGTYTLRLAVHDGNSGDIDTTTATIAAIPVVDPAQSSAQLIATLDTDKSTVRLDWRDSFPAGTTYRIERQNPNGTFSPIETVAGAGGGLAPISWDLPYPYRVTSSAIDPMVLRVWAVTPGGELPLLTPQGQRALSLQMPSITGFSSSAAPVSGVKLLAAGVSGPDDGVMSWLIDGVAVGTGSQFSWDTTTAPSGLHAVTLRGDRGNSIAYEAKRFITTSNPNFAVTASHARLHGTVNVDVRATSQAGVTSVSLAMDGGAAATLTAPNACINDSCAPGDPPNAYRFTFNAATLGAGGHTASISAIDGASATKSLNLAVPVSGPSLTVSTPQAGAFVATSLSVQGNTTGLDGSPVTVTAYLGATQILQTTSTNFNGSLNLAGVAPGRHTLTVVAQGPSGAVTAVRRSIVVASGAALAHQPVFQAGDSDALAAAFGDFIVYQTPDGVMRLRNVATSSEFPLAGTIGPQPRWAMAGDSLYRLAQGPVCGAVTPCVVRQLLSTGAVTNLTALNSKFVSADLRAEGGHVALKGQTGLIVHNTQTAAFFEFDCCGGSFGLGSWDFALATSGAPVVYYWFQILSGDRPHDLYRWTPTVPASSARVQHSTDGPTPPDVSIDSASATYHVSPFDSGIIGSPYKGLRSRLLLGDAEITLSSSDTGLVGRLLQRGVTIWEERIPSFGALVPHFDLKARGPSGATVTLVPDAPSFGQAGSGFAAFHQPSDGNTYAFNGATGVSTLRVNGGPYTVFITGAWMYFQSGSGIYRVALN